jgi:hypothetical protein
MNIKIATAVGLLLYSLQASGGTDRELGERPLSYKGKVEGLFFLIELVMVVSE